MAGLTSEPGVIELAAQIRSGALSPMEAVDAAISRIEGLDGPINAIVVRDFDRARDAAKALGKAEPRPDQPLYGLPMTVKEAFDVAGLPTTWGLEEFRENVAAEDATIVSRLKEAGAIILGKSNVPPALADIQSSNPIHGRTVNPHDHSRTSGGSSGGSAAALATGMVPGEFGSDIGGSIRIPSHFCGVWGHKPTWGAVSAKGHDFPGADGHDRALNVVGPMARSGDDLAALFEVTADRPMQTFPKPIRECRFLHIANHPLGETENAMLGVYEDLIGVLEDEGAKIDRMSDLIPDLTIQHQDYLAMLMIMIDLDSLESSRPWPTLRDWFALMDAQARCQRSWQKLFACYDFVLAPPFPSPALPNDGRPIFKRTMLINGAEIPLLPSAVTWSGLVTFPGLPSTVLPVGKVGVLPVGLQVIGAPWRDRDCIDAATQIGKLLSN